MNTNRESAFPALSLQSCLQNIEAALRAGDSSAAMRFAAEGTARGHVHPGLLTLAAHERLAAGDGAGAFAHAEKARGLAPRDPNVLNVCGLSLMALDRAGEALSAFDGALKQAPNMAVMHFNKGHALETLGRMKQARAAYNRALAIEPAYAQALARIAYMAALSGDTKTAREYGERALAQNPREIPAVLALALADIEEKKFADALAHAKAIGEDAAMSPVNRSIALGLMGDAHDGLGEQAQAFEAYTASNAVLRAAVRPVYEAPGIETAPAHAARLAEYFGKANPKVWQIEEDAPLSKPSAKSPLKTHVFLIGFPRSGTTLLEQVLASHGDVETMDERDCLAAAAESFVTADGGLERLVHLSGTALDPWRKAYWKSAAESGHTASRGVFIDKMPLNIVLLPLIAKLFPNAKIIFALRDPRDVVFSCFRRRFAMSAQMYEFLALDSAARYYDAVMGLGEIYRGLFGLDAHVLRYEDMIAGFEGEARKLCTFLGLEWNESLRDFAKKTSARGIDTPSAAQVARGLYKSGAGQWRAYRAQLEPVLPLLAPWVARFGYEEE